MKWYGSINNRLDENKQFCEEIKVGTGMTEYYWSDSHAFEVIAVKDQKHVTVREYDHKCKGGAYSNDWELISNEDNYTMNMVKRGKYWYSEVIIKLEEVDLNDWEERLWLAHQNVTVEELQEKKIIKRYHRKNVSFGVARYYYDYEF